MGTLHLGYHRGTLMSRDTVNVEIESEQAAREYVDQAEKDYARHGGMIWFASYREHDDSEPIKLHKGNSYS